MGGKTICVFLTCAQVVVLLCVICRCHSHAILIVQDSLRHLAIDPEAVHITANEHVRSLLTSLPLVLVHGMVLKALCFLPCLRFLSCFGSFSCVPIFLKLKICVNQSVFVPQFSQPKPDRPVEIFAIGSSSLSPCRNAGTPSSFCLCFG